MPSLMNYVLVSFAKLKKLSTRYFPLSILHIYVSVFTVKVVMEASEFRWRMGRYSEDVGCLELYKGR